jgi:hypothetical protein
MLAQTYALLEKQAALIDNDALRASFLKNVAVHREIVAEFERTRQMINPQD